MNKEEVNRLQSILCSNLMQYFAPKGFLLDKIEWRIYSEKIRLPFFTSFSRGVFFTINPSIRLVVEELTKNINSIVDEGIQVNGRFVFCERLNRVFGRRYVELPFQDKVTEVGGSFSWRIYDESDLVWVEEWYIAYMEAIGWKLIKQLSDDETIYNFYKDLFITWTKDDPQLNVFDRSYALDMGAHATMIYLGRRDQHQSVDELIDLTREHLPNSLYWVRTDQLKRYFDQS